MRATFTRRQKEQARKEKQRAKAERKLQRKLELGSDIPAIEPEPADSDENREVAEQSPLKTSESSAAMLHNLNSKEFS